MQTDGLVIFAKAPLAGKVKTRLVPHLTPMDAAELYQAFILDTLDRLSPLRDVKHYMACYPSSADPFFIRLGKDYKIERLDQRGGDLGERMGGVVETLMNRGLERIVLVGADSPTLPTSYLEQAFAALKVQPVVVGPSQDGGYYLIGLSQWTPELFDDIPWGTEKVLELTLQRIHDLGMKCEVLPKWFDVDDLIGLKALIKQLAHEPGIAPHTEAFLKTHKITQTGYSS